MVASFMRVDISGFPNVQAYFNRMLERPSVKDLLAFEKQGNGTFAETGRASIESRGQTPLARSSTLSLRLRRTPWRPRKLIRARCRIEHPISLSRLASNLVEVIQGAKPKVEISRYKTCRLLPWPEAILKSLLP